MPFPSSYLLTDHHQTFLGLISLETGTELVALSLIVNKATGAYGLLAILTGYALSPLQFTMYLYSVAVLASVVICLPHIRRHTPFHNLALAWLYILDTFANAAYTAAFAVTWYQASFHDPEGNAGKDAGPTEGVPDGSNLDPAQKAAGKAVHEGAVSLCLIVFFTVVRIYFALVVAAFSRSVLLVKGEGEESWENKTGHEGNPFAPGRAGGQGWKGWAGRKMVSVGRWYWLGRKDDEEWTKDTGRKYGRGRNRAVS
jgi:hypothetical protein